ncbi:DNA gyrase subunit A [Psittacicella melopsittaci]|uniref:DNA topoisomerase (ATP-hydrolyzing) n=1 Tax=Psittacicella melopsittaci TaxID=2028576 RepID=A0A3A1Y906_9GAMM|nr:DNA gyrase subunit A [Psittacicella melopsittaci]RIY33700.1 DNA gyrase subunit A [Psittacicella melopsittaci]
MSESNNQNPSGFNGEVKPINIVDELKTSYLDYAMSVIMSRALPDARDGFKPVHRRVLYAMHEGGNTPDKPFVKSAEIVGKVMGLYHPHGDYAIYGTLVRMAQDFSLRYPLVQGQGNFGGRGDEAPAAMRYTEARMSNIALELLKDIKKDTVDFIPNYSNKTTEPLVLPTRLPNLLINGSSGIAVGMATNIPPHNLTEVLNGCIAYVDNPEISIDQLMEYIPAPDFPTGGIILGRGGIREAYHTGRGKLYLRAVYKVSEEARVKRINITEIPYQVSYNTVIERIHDLMKNDEIQGITEVLNLSKNDINIELRIHKDYDPHVIMNQLFAKTQLQSSISFNMLALNKGKPQTLNLKQFISIFIEFRREVITRRCVFELKGARTRAHTLEALAIALDNIDEIIHLIRSSARRQDAAQALLARGWNCKILSAMLENLEGNPEIARPANLEEQYGVNPQDGLYYLSPEQADDILSMQLSRLTGLEQEVITSEYQDKVSEIIRLIGILNDPAKLTAVLRQELIESRDNNKRKENNYDARISAISDEAISLDDESFINKEDVVITYSRDSYIKYQALNEYRSQSRGGRGRQATQVKENDEIAELVIGKTTDTLLCFTSLGRVFQIKVYKLPRATQASRGRPINNFLNLQDEERITNLIVLDEDAQDDVENKFLFFATEQGTVKKTPLKQFSKIRANGLKAITLRNTDIAAGEETENEEVEVLEAEDTILDSHDLLPDRLAQVVVVGENDPVYLFSRAGYVAAFNSAVVRSQSRVSRGVRGMRLQEGDDRIIAVIVPKNDDPILTVTNGGLGKRTALSEVPLRTNRGSKGVRMHKLSERTGNALVGATQINEQDQLAIITDGGKLVRIDADEIRLVGRASSGVKLVNLVNGEQVASIERIVEGKSIEAEDLLAVQAHKQAELADNSSPVKSAEQVEPITGAAYAEQDDEE